MNDDLPTPERLGRIERGVQRRIDRRRQVARQIAGASVTVLIVVGGVALVRPLLVFSSSGASSAGGTAARSSAERATTVICHTGSVTTNTTVRDDLPTSAVAACTAETTMAAPAARPGDLAGTPSPSPTPVLCESTKGIVHVYLGDPASCATHGLQPFVR